MRPRERTADRVCCRGWCRGPMRRVFEAAWLPASHGAGMATTLVACALRHDRAVVAHVGDSRCYLIRRGEATVLTRDHTVASEHARLGLLSAGRSRGGRHAPHSEPLAGRRFVRRRRDRTITRCFPAMCCCFARMGCTAR